MFLFNRVLVLEFMHQIVIHRRVSDFVAIFIRVITVKVYLLICVFNLSSTNDTYGNVLLTLAVCQVVHGLSLTPAGIRLVVCFLHSEPDTDNHSSTAQQQHEDQDNPSADGDPGELGILAFGILLSEVNNDRSLRWLGEQKLAVEPTIASGTFTDIAVVSFVAGGPVVAGVVLTSAHWGAAVLPIVSRGAGAGIVIDTILAGPSIDTGKGGAVIHIIITVSPSESSLALAYVGIPQINALGSCKTLMGIRAEW